ncbi:MAG: hypothetical protein ACYC6W_12670 [Nitrosotalea sp.]
MWEQHKKSLKIQTIILIALSVSFVPVSYFWYDALSGFDCKKFDQNHVTADPSDKHDTCISKTSSHWMIFYGVNIMIYAMPFVLIVKSTRNRSTEDL